MLYYRTFLLIASVISSALGLFIYFQPKKTSLNILLGLYNIVVCVWFIGQYMGEIVKGKEAVLFWTRINLAGALFIPILFVHFVSVFTDNGKKNNKKIILGYIVSFLLLLFIPTRFFIRDIISTQYFRYYPQGGPVYYVFALLFVLFLFYGFYELIKAFLSSKGARKNQISYVLFASFIGFGGGISQFLPVFGINIYPFGVFIVPLYAFIAAYAILKHRLLDIKIVIKKGLAYSILIGLFSGFYMLAIYILLKIFQQITGFTSALTAIFTLLCFAVLFDPLRDKTIKMIDSLSNKEIMNYELMLKDISSVISSSIKTNEILDVFCEKIVNNLKISGAAVFLLNSDRNVYSLKKQVNLGSINPEYLSDLGGFISNMQECTPVDELENKEILDDLKKMGVSIIIPLISKGSSLGFIIFGEKYSLDMWNGEDINFLSTISSHLATALENSFLYEEIIAAQKSIYQKEKLSALGQVAASAAHEIKNPLTSLKGMAQILPDRLNDKEFLKEFSGISVRQIDRINLIVENLLKLGRKNENEEISDNFTAQEISINEILEEIIKLIRVECAKNAINITLDTKNILRINADREQAYKAFLNIILNAMQAMPEGGDLGIKILGKTVLITDTGIGISKEDIDNIFNPFFTTKAKGMGLGLSGANKIIADSGGKIEVASEAGKGTFFTIKF